MGQTGGAIVLREGQLKAVEACIGSAQSAWKLLVHCKDESRVQELKAERTQYFVAVRSTLADQMSLMLTGSLPSTEDQSAADKEVSVVQDSEAVDQFSNEVADDVLSSSGLMYLSSVRMNWLILKPRWI